LAVWVLKAPDSDRPTLASLPGRRVIENKCSTDIRARLAFKYVNAHSDARGSRMTFIVCSTNPLPEALTGFWLMRMFCTTLVRLVVPRKDTVWSRRR